MNNDTVNNLLMSPETHCFFVLDIDSTLVTTWQRNQAILEAFVASHSHFPEEDLRQLRKGQCQLGDYGLETCLKRIGFEPENTNTRNELMQYWRKHFFSNDFLHADRPTEGAVSWVQKLSASGVDFIFLTARHYETMWEGTLRSMKDLGFPATEKNLFLKKDMSDSDEVYKSKLMKEIKKNQAEKTIWFIDNEPVVLNQIAEDHPDVQLVWFDSTHSRKMLPPEGISVIKSFDF